MFILGLQLVQLSQKHEFLNFRLMNTLPSRKGSFARILRNVLESLDFIADTSEDVPKVTDAGLVLHRPKIQDTQIKLGEVLRRHRRPLSTAPV